MIKKRQFASLFMVALLVLLSIGFYPSIELRAEGDVEINATNFPDDFFRKKVKDFDTDKDGLLSQAEREAVTSIGVIGMGIADLTGIKSFPNLENLYCSQNKLTSIDLNGLTKLTSLHCPFNQLTSLELTGVPNLKWLYCDNNQLSSLDLSSLPQLEKLTCNNNKLTSLSVIGLTKLDTLYCSGNQLASLDVSGLNLPAFVCDDNEISFTVTREKPTDPARFDITSLPAFQDKSKVSFNPAGSPGYSYDAATGIVTIDQTLADVGKGSVGYLYTTGHPTTNMYVKLNWTVKLVEKVTVSFDGNSGGGQMAPVQLDKDQEYILPTSQFVAPSGKEFKAWLVNGQELAVGDKVKISADTLVTAVWKAIVQPTQTTRPTQPTQPTQPSQSSRPNSQPTRSKDQNNKSVGQNQANQSYKRSNQLAKPTGQASKQLPKTGEMSASNLIMWTLFAASAVVFILKKRIEKLLNKD